MIYLLPFAFSDGVGLLGRTYILGLFIGTIAC